MKLGRDIELEAKKIDEKIRKLKEQKAQLAETLEAERQRKNLALKVGLLLLDEYEGKPFEYADFQQLMDSKLTTDFEREAFQLDPLPSGDPRKPKKRGRKKKTEE